MPVINHTGEKKEYHLLYVDLKQTIQEFNDNKKH